MVAKDHRSARLPASKALQTKTRKRRNVHSTNTHILDSGRSGNGDEQRETGEAAVIDAKDTHAPRLRGRSHTSVKQLAPSSTDGAKSENPWPLVYPGGQVGVPSRL